MNEEYSMDMSEEQAPKIKKLLPEGWRDSKIVSCKDKPSKSGNPMFTFGILDKEKNYITDFYAIATPKKRWNLKMLLAACGVEAAEDGKYNWKITDVMEKEIKVLLVHEENTWIDRDGNDRSDMQHKIVDIKPVEVKGWDEGEK